MPEQVPNLEAFILASLEKIAQHRRSDTKMRDPEGILAS